MVGSLGARGGAAAEWRLFLFFEVDPLWGTASSEVNEPWKLDWNLNPVSLDYVLIKEFRLLFF